MFLGRCGLVFQSTEVAEELLEWWLHLDLVSISGMSKLHMRFNKKSPHLIWCNLDFSGFTASVAEGQASQKHAKLPQGICSIPRKFDIRVLFWSDFADIVAHDELWGDIVLESLIFATKTE